MEDTDLYDLYDNDETALDYDDEPYDEQDAYLPKSPLAAQAEEDNDPQEEPMQDDKPESPELEDAPDDVPTDRGDHQDGKVSELQAQLKDTQYQLDRMRHSLRDIASVCGVPFTSTKDPDPVAVGETVQQLISTKAELQEEGKQMRKLEAALQIHIAEKNMDAIELRRELNSVQQQADPSIIQLKQLLLDPAVNKEFQRLKSELQNCQRELKHAQEEAQAMNFTQESKTGRLLMQKCRALQEENEEMGKELAEGKQAQLESQLALAKEYAQEMQKNYLELQDHCSMLDEEAEELQQQVVSLRRQNQELEQQLNYHMQGPNAGRMKQDGFFDRKGPAPGPRPFERKRLPPPVDKDMGQRFMGRKRIR